MKFSCRISLLIFQVLILRLELLYAGRMPCDRAAYLSVQYAFQSASNHIHHTDLLHVGEVCLQSDSAQIAHVDTG